TGGFDKYSLISSKACCCSAPHGNSSSDLIFTKPMNGSMRPDRLEINRLTKLILPMSFCNSFFVVGGFIIFTASSLFRHQESQKLTGRYAKGTFLWVHFEPKLPSPLQDLTQIFQVSPSRCGLDHDIINVDLYQLADEIMKNVIHGTLICCTGIFQSKGHDQVLEQPDRTWYSERGLVYILWGHKNLIVASITIYKAHHLMASCCVDQRFCNRHQILIFWRCSVEISKIHADSPSAIFFLYRDHARDPF